MNEYSTFIDLKSIYDTELESSGNERSAFSETLSIIKQEFAGNASIKVLSSNNFNIFDEVLPAIGLPIYKYENNRKLEAFNTLVSKSNQSVIISDSWHMAHFIGESTKLKIGKTLIDSSNCESYTGIRPEQVIDIASLTGGEFYGAKNIIGFEMAKKAINTRNNLRGLLENKEKAAPNIKFVLNSKFDEIVSNRKKLSQISSDYDFKIIHDEIDVKDEYVAIAKNGRHEDLPWIRDEDKKQIPFIKNEFSDTTLFRWIDNSNDIKNFIQKAPKKRSIACLISGNIMSMTNSPGESVLIDLGTDFGIKAAKFILSNPDIMISSHEAKSLYHWCHQHNCEFKGLTVDTSILAFAVNSKDSELSIKDIVQRAFGYEMDSTKKQGESKDNHRARVVAESSDMVLRSGRELYVQAQKSNQPSLEAFRNIDMPMIKILFEMEKNGMRIDLNYFKKLKADIDKKSEDAIKGFKKEFGNNFNPNSPQDVAELIFDKMGLPDPSKKRSVSQDMLESIAKENHLVRKIMDFRKDASLSSKNIVPYINATQNRGDRIHATLYQNVAATTRLSAREPNLHGVSNQGEGEDNIRSGFIADDDKYLLAIDYSQIELRVLAHLSGDEVLIKAFHNNEDIHRATAATIFDTPIEKVTGEQRRYSKAINFGIIYGMSDFGLSKKIGCSQETAKAFISDYFKKFPKVHQYLEGVKEFSSKNGFTQTITGRKLNHHNAMSNDWREKSSALRSAINSPMQGSAAEIIKIAMIKAQEFIESKNLKTKMIMQVHDELIFEVPKDEAGFVTKPLIDIMENAVPLKVPLIADAGIGKTWEASHSLDLNKNNDISIANHM